MRTTLDIDDDVLQAAKELAKVEKRTAGEVLSDLARKGLVAGRTATGPTTPEGFVLDDGWYVLPARGGVVTSELVKQLELEADLADAGLIRRERPPRADG